MPSQHLRFLWQERSLTYNNVYALMQNGNRFIGTHCEVKLKNECGTIVADAVGTKLKFSIILYDNDSGEKTLFTQYNRPVYSHVEGIQDGKEGDINWIVYTGRRWVFIGFNPAELNMTYADVFTSTGNYHAYWSEQFSYASGGLTLTGMEVRSHICDHII